MKRRSFFIFVCLLLLGFASCTSTEQKSDKSSVAKTSTKNNEEFLRSTQNVQVSVDEFNADKNTILKKIAELAVIMQKQDYNAWCKYIEPNSLHYWSNANNLKAASKRLPVKGLSIATLTDYFNMVFIPSRKDHQVDEIRYIDRNNVKAVQVINNDDIIYYYFVRENNDWMVKLPALPTKSNLTKPN